MSRSKRAPAFLALFLFLLKMGVPLASVGLVCVSGVIAHGSRVGRSVGILSGFLGLFPVCGRSAMLGRPCSAYRWGRTGRILGGL